jgi:hypothetical protein
MKPWTIPGCLCLSVFLHIMSGPALAESTGIRITEMTVTSKIFKGNPVDSIKRISTSSVKALYCFTRIDSSTDEETSVRHVWYHDGEKVGEYALPVKARGWRTYSKKFIAKDEVGTWRVEAQDREGNVLRSVDFRMN